MYRFRTTINLVTFCALLRTFRSTLLPFLIPSPCSTKEWTYGRSLRMGRVRASCAVHVNTDLRSWLNNRRMRMRTRAGIAALIALNILSGVDMKSFEHNRCFLELSVVVLAASPTSCRSRSRPLIAAPSIFIIWSRLSVWPLLMCVGTLPIPITPESRCKNSSAA